MAKEINIKEYLDSGVLEEYVLGLLPELKAREVAMLVQLHPELKDAVEEIEYALIAYGESYQTKEPGESVLTHALAEIDKLESEEKEEGSNPVVTELDADSSSEDQSAATIKRFDRWTYLAIAASILLLISIGLNYVFYQNWQEADQELLALRNDNTQLAEENQTYRTSLDQSEAFFAHLEDKDSKPVRLEGLDAAPGGTVLLSWNSRTQEVLLVNYDLPNISEEQQYQLWAIVGGKPVDAGVIHKDRPIQFMKSVDGAPVQFAITLEPKGGSENPTLEKMYAAGAVG